MTMTTNKKAPYSLTNEVVKWTKEFLAKCGTNKAVIGISGGKDSSVCAAVCVKALGKENVLGVLMPNGEQKDISDSLKLVNHLGIKHITINIKDGVDNTVNQIKELLGNVSYDTLTNIPARERLKNLYAVQQTWGGMVANTCNLSEDMVGYSTLFGDNGGSFAPLSRLTTEEIIEIGDELGLPHELTHKTPIDGLQSLSDEDKLGFTYHEVNELIRKGVTGPNADKIIKMYNANKFKLEMVNIKHFDPGFPNFITGENTWTYFTKENR